MPRFASTAEIRGEVADLLRPPRRITVSEAAQRHLRVKGPGGAYIPWDPDVTPYMLEPMDCLTSRKYRGVVFVGPSRSGKTAALCDAWLAHMITCAPVDMLIVNPSQDMARDYSRKRVDRMFRHCPAVGRHLSTRGQDDNTFDKRLRNGTDVNLGWPSITQLASRDFQNVAFPDYDRGDEQVAGEGNKFDLGSKRTQTFLSRGMTMAESSPGWEIEDHDWRPTSAHEAPPTRGIMALYNRGDRRRIYWQCPDCTEWFEPTFQRMEWDQMPDIVRSADTVRLVCPSCSSPLPQSAKRGLNHGGVWLADGLKIVRGEIVGSARQSQIASFWAQGPVAGYQTWSGLVYNALQADAEYARTGSEESIKTTVAVDQGCPYLPKRKQSDRDIGGLEARREPWEKRTIPKGVRFLTAAIDVQGGKNAPFIVSVMGHGANREQWIIARFGLWQSRRVDADGDPLRIDPGGHPEDWDVLTAEVVEASYSLGDGSGRRMPIRRVACDSGGEAGVTDRAYEWWRQLRKQGLHRRVMLVKGSSAKDAPRFKKTYPDSTRRADRKASSRGDVPVWLINTAMGKDVVLGDLDRAEPGPGYIHVPEWLKTKYLEEFYAEKKTAKGYEKISARNESLDLAVYNRVAWLTMGGEKINWAAPPTWAREWDANHEIIQSGGMPVAKPRQTGPVRRVRFQF